MECQIKGVNYQAPKLDVFAQLRVSRKLLPVLASLMADMGSVRELLPADGEFEGANMEALSPVLDKVLPRIAQEISDLSEEDTNAIIHSCLSVVVRQQGTTWTPIMRSGTLMFDDIDLMTMLQLVARVVADSLGNFLPELPTSATSPGQPQS